MTGRIIHGDCLDVLAGMADASFDAVVTDPPYNLDFMGHATGWDDYATPRQFQAWCESWAKQLLRVLKPGGHLLAFGGTRTYHRLACGLEDAGFEMRDSIIAWAFATGFPKSHDVSKALDRQREERHEEALAVTTAIRAAMMGACLTRRDLNVACGLGDSDAGSAQSWTTAAVGAHKPRVPTIEQWAALRDLLDLRCLDVEVWRLNGRKGTPGEAWGQREVVGSVTHARSGGEDFAKIPGAVATARTVDVTAPATELAQRYEGFGTALKPSFEPIVVARKPLAGTVAQNVERWGVGGINVDGCRIPTGDDLNGGAYSGGHRQRDEYTSTDSAPGAVPMSRLNRGIGEFDAPSGRWPTNMVLCHSPSCVEGRCVEDCHVAEMDRQSGDRPGAHDQEHRSKSASHVVGVGNIPGQFNGRNDSGGASRFYPCFRFEAKADSSERMAGPDGTKHVTVKPVDLMRWLIRLVSPPDGGRILDPFAGSGSTLVAAFMEDVECVGIEKDARYVPIIEKRLEQAESRGAQTSLFGIGQ